MATYDPVADAQARLQAAQRAYFGDPNDPLSQGAQPSNAFFRQRQEAYAQALADYNRARTQRGGQQSGGARQGLGGPQQASQDIYGATYGAAQQTMADPRLNELMGQLDTVISGQNVPFSQERIQRELSAVGDMTAAAAGNQAQQLREWGASRGFMPNDPAMQARMQEIEASRMIANQQARGDLGRAALATNFDAQQQAINQALMERFQRMGLANQQNLSGAGYSAQVQRPTQYMDPNAGVQTMLNALQQMPQAPVQPYTPQQQAAPAPQQQQAAPAPQVPQALRPTQAPQPTTWSMPAQPPRPQQPTNIRQEWNNFPANGQPIPFTQVSPPPNAFQQTADSLAPANVLQGGGEALLNYFGQIFR